MNADLSSKAFKHLNYLIKIKAAPFQQRLLQAYLSEPEESAAGHGSGAASTKADT
ncbi:MAG: hypothetical protein KIT18_13445 [Burkholderiales bacterium]|nr:hypothetical protein [Burkholderiales bacterium]